MINLSDCEFEGTDLETVKTHTFNFGIRQQDFQCQICNIYLYNLNYNKITVYALLDFNSYNLVNLTCDEYLIMNILL